MQYKLSIMDSIYEGWGAFKKHPWVAMGVLAFFMFIGYIPNLIVGDPTQTDPMSPETIMLGFLMLFLGLIMLFVYPPIMGGYLWTFVKIARDDRPSFGNIFDGFRRYGAYLGYVLLFGIIIFVVVMVAIIGIAIVMAATEIATTGDVNTDGEPPLGMMVAIIALMIIVMLIMFRFLPALMLFLDEPEIKFFDALKKSHDLVKGNYWRYLGLYVISGIIAFAAAVINWSLYIPFLQQTIAEQGFLKVMEYPSILAIPVSAVTTVMQAMGYVRLKEAYDKENPPGIKPAPPGFVPPSDFRPSSPNVPPTTDLPPSVDDLPKPDYRPKDEPPPPEFDR